MKLFYPLILFACLIFLPGCHTLERIIESRNTTPLTSEMALLPEDATTSQMVLAFEADYARAAKTAGINANHTSLVYELHEDTAQIELEGLILMIDPPAGFYRVWYAGYPESEDWMRQEAQLVLMAADNTLTADEGAELVKNIYKAAWENRNNNPSAVNAKTPGGIKYSLSLNDRGLVSFFITLDT